MQFRNGVPPEQGAIWLTYYPNITVSGIRTHAGGVVAVAAKREQDGERGRVLRHAEEVACSSLDFIVAQQAAYMETCVEDDEIGVRMDAGRRRWNEGRVEVGPIKARWRTAC